MAGCATQIVRVTLDSFIEDKLWLNLLSNFLDITILVCDALLMWSFTKIFYEATNLYYHLQTRRIKIDTSRIPNDII